MRLDSLRIYKLALSFILLSFFAIKTSAQASWEPFGQNRVQYRTFNWSYYDTTNFRCFYYDKGKESAIYCVNIAEEELQFITQVMGGSLSKKINIIIYNNFSDYRQTNLGRHQEDMNAADGGRIDIVGNSMPIYFNGDHMHLKRQIRKGLATRIKNKMLFGDNIKDVIKNSMKMNLPEWFGSGHIAYISDEWTPALQLELQNMVASTNKNKFEDLALAYPSLVGHSFWNFIASKYGENTITNILYLIRFRKSINQAIESVLNKPAKDVFQEWEAYELRALNEEHLSLDSMKHRMFLTTIKKKFDAQYTRFAVSPKGGEVAYVMKHEGVYHVMIHETKYGKSVSMLSGGIRAAKELADPDYPIIAWSPTGDKLVILYSNKKNTLLMKTYFSGSKKTNIRAISARRVERITGACFMGDENTLVITGIKKGQSDLMRLNIKTAKVENITTDLFDDKDPVYIESEAGSGILFLSNRKTNYIGENSRSQEFEASYDLYLYEPSKGNNLRKLSDVNAPIHNHAQWGMNAFTYLSNESGKTVRKIVKIKQQAPLPDTFEVVNAAPLEFICLKQEYLHRLSKVAEITIRDKDLQVFLTPHFTLNEWDTKYLDSVSKQDPVILDTTSVQEAKLSLPPNIEYITSFDDDTAAISLQLESIFTEKKLSKGRYLMPSDTILLAKPKKYTPTFYLDFIQTSLDNTLLFTRYQPFGYFGGQFYNQPLAGFITSSLTDVLEDYKITGGLRLGSDLRSLDYFLKYENFRRRSDWGITYLHTKRSNLYDFRDGAPPNFSPYPVVGNVSTDYIQGNWAFPLDITQSFRLSMGLRYDKIRVKAQDQYSLGIENNQEFWMVSRAEYVYDNTINPLLNIRKGSRAKFFFEYQYKFNEESKGFYNFGYDMRNYLTLHKNIILASRWAGAHSFGNAKIIYFLGGVDNDFSPQFDQNTIIDYSQNYAFQSLATNLRGYKQGTRNGNSYSVINEEIRVPVYNTFFKGPTKSGFIRHLQLVAFADLGSAWNGILPNSDNIRNTAIVRDQNGTVTVFLRNSKSDVSLGYGAGLRSRFLGYFIRTDFAWSVDGGRRPMIHVSMATDF